MRIGIFAAVASFVFGQGIAISGFAQDTPLQSGEKVYRSEGQKFVVDEVMKRDGVIWGFDFLPSGDILFTERAGTLGLLDMKTKKVTSIKGVPQVFNEDQGGLLDVKLHPDFKKTKWVYLSYAKPVEGKSTTAFGRGRLEGDTLKDYKDLFVAKDPSTNSIHYGSRIVFDGKGKVFVSVGERNERPWVQSLKHHMGKIVRLNDDGSVPKDNPFVGQKDALPEIWSLGHRNQQGLALHPITGELWEAEMGPLGGDELNLIKPGANYGWPVLTYGREYSGKPMGEGQEKPGFENPVAHWVPSISPSGLAFHSGRAFPKWKGNAFLANLGGTHIRRVVLEKEGRTAKVVAQESLLGDMNTRFRDVQESPEGHLMAATDDGRILRLRAVK